MNTDQLTESINSKIRNRNVEETPPPLLSFYPKSTRYIQTPVVDPSISIKPMKEKKWAGYSVNIESELNNQLFQLNSSNKNVYVPSSTSDLYNYPSISNNQYASLDKPLQKSKSEYIFNNPSR
jgi:hypothetical protein